MGPAYPNPFNPLTNFTLTVARDQRVVVEVYNLLGERLDQLFDGNLYAGEARTFRFEARTGPAGCT